MAVASTSNGIGEAALLAVSSLLVGIRVIGWLISRQISSRGRLHSLKSEIGFLAQLEAVYGVHGLKELSP